MVASDVTAHVVSWLDQAKWEHPKTSRHSFPHISAEAFTLKKLPLGQSQALEYMTAPLSPGLKAVLPIVVEVNPHKPVDALTGSIALKVLDRVEDCVNLARRHCDHSFHSKNSQPSLSTHTIPHAAALTFTVLIVAI
ncbi:hypothetical protein HK100_005931 [Physocladia obscura]|uniref:Uncharacterized protein n=1 Tax=Physocladia obscura TaxID=109957 RepID=A0AAD5SSG8_9FUNG|nr:hypothetical protein HK100_005931 [Physocladia obscura]